MANIKVDKKVIRELAALLEETGLSEIELEDDGKRLRVARGGAAQAAAAPAATVAPAAAPAAADDAAHPGAVLSPMVGTVYLKPSPDAEPFVRVGDQVAAGQPLVIIEAMKTMNQIPAPKAGKVTRLLISDGEPVEYGDPLMIIE